MRIKNQQPHSLPTGAPFRNMFVKLTAYNDKGESVWESAKGHPAESDPQAYFSFSMVDDAGKPAPPPVATKPGPDSRLKPHEDRLLSYEIPARGVVLVRGEFYYGLLWPGLAKQFSQLPENVRTPILVAAVDGRSRPSPGRSPDVKREGAAARQRPFLLADSSPTYSSGRAMTMASSRLCPAG